MAASAAALGGGGEGGSVGASSGFWRHAGKSSERPKSNLVSYAVVGFPGVTAPLVRIALTGLEHRTKKQTHR